MHKDNFEAVDLSENQLVALERDVFLPLISGSNFARVNIKSSIGFFKLKGF